MRQLAPFVLLGSIFYGIADAQPRQQQIDLQAAIRKEAVEGDLNGAIKQYAAIVSKYSKTDRAIAATALVHMAECHQKLGDAEARKIYEQIVRDYFDQAEIRGKAEARLAALGKPAETGVTARRVWASTLSEDRDFGFSVTLDGRYLAFVDDNADTINLMDTVTGEDHRVLGKTASGGRPSFRWVEISPDGRKLAYSVQPSGGLHELHVVGRDGTNPRRLTDGIPMGWSPDGTHILAQRYTSATPENRGVVVVSVADGSTRLLGSGVNWARYSPDGRYIAMIRAARPGTMQAGKIYVMAADGGPEVPLADGTGNSVAWTPDSKNELFVSDRRGSNDLWSVRVVNGRPDGSPQLAREHVQWVLGVSQDGSVYTIGGHVVRDICEMEVDLETGRPTSAVQRLTMRYINSAPAWSRDGESLVYYSRRGPAAEGDGAQTIVVRSVRTGEERIVPLKNPLSLGLYRPHWFADGRSIFTRLFGAGPGTLVRIDLQTGEDQKVLSQATLSYAGYIDGQTVALAPDGRAVYYLTRDEQNHQTRIIVRGLDGNGEKELARVAADRVYGPVVTRDNNRLVFSTISDSGDWSLLTVPTTGGETKEIYRPRDFHAMPYAGDPVWSKDGRRLYFATGVPKGKSSGGIWSIPAEGGDPQPLGVVMNTPGHLDLHPDGKRLVFTNEETTEEIWVLKNLFSRLSALR
jgi:Tol biopolymer transport system component